MIELIKMMNLYGFLNVVKNPLYYEKKYNTYNGQQ